MSEVTAIKTVNLTKTCAGGMKALDNLDLEFREGTFAAILEPEGSGKTTLLNLISALDSPTSGWVEVFGRRVHAMVSPDIFRAKEIGFIFQDSILLPVLSAIDNVLIPSHALPSSKARAQKRANELLEMVGLGDKKNSLPRDLTNGEKQLVTVARAFINDPRIVLAYEPAGSVDAGTSDKIFDVLNEIHNTTYTTIIISTGNLSIASRADQIVTIKEGKIKDIKAPDEK